MSSIYNFAASVNAYDDLSDGFGGDMINHRVKRPYGMWIHVEIFFWMKNKEVLQMKWSTAYCTDFFNWVLKHGGSTASGVW